MTRTAWGAVGVAALLSAACATSSGVAPSAEYDLRVTDRPSLSRFDLELTARESPLCFGIAQWPDRQGRVQGSARAVVVTERGRFPARDFNFGYCQGKSCTIRVPARGKITGFVGYSQFPVDADLDATRSRSLEYNLNPYTCR